MGKPSLGQQQRQQHNRRAAQYVAQSSTRPPALMLPVHEHLKFLCQNECRVALLIFDPRERYRVTAFAGKITRWMSRFLAC
jgi:hypothetical protein